MSARITTLLAVLATLSCVCCAPAAAQQVSDADLGKAFAALKAYDWGMDRTDLAALDKAVAASHKDDAAKKDLEKQLAALLPSKASSAAKDIVCRQLSLIGSAESVPALAALLTDEKLSHMARYALERMPCEEAVVAMRKAAPGVKGRQKIGVINSLGIRRDTESVAMLTELLGAEDTQTAAAAASALGSIGNSAAAKSLAAFRTKAPAKLKLDAADASLKCAERLLSDGKKLEAMVIYRELMKAEQKHVVVAAQRGLLAAMKAR